MFFPLLWGPLLWHMRVAVSVLVATPAGDCRPRVAATPSGERDMWVTSLDGGGLGTGLGETFWGQTVINYCK